VVARAEENQLGSIATPAISTGIFGYPVEEAAEVAVHSIIELSPHVRSLMLVRFVLWSEHDHDVHVRTLERIAS
jgi:O-acetyl-ADP-ribose deacetylase (regulator of RNase III)